MADKKITELPSLGSLPSDDSLFVVVDAGATKQVSRQNALGITGAVVGTDDTQTLTNKTLTSPTINSPSGIVKADVGLGNVDNTSDATKNSASATLTNKTLSTGSVVDANVTVTEVLKKVYPVGSIYIATVSTDPNTLFGFGTWSAFGAGKTLVSLDSGDTDFDTVEETGGSKTHTLTTAEMPVHTHIQDAHTHTQNAHSHTQNTGAWSAYGSRMVSSNTGSSGSYTTGEATAVNQNTTATNQNAGSGNAHNNLQPYIVVYMWKRTA